jgi:hypothetical protein
MRVSEAYLPAKPLQDLIRKRIEQADHAEEVLRRLRCNSGAISRIMRQKRISLTVADRWATRLDYPLALLYPEHY